MTVRAVLDDTGFGLRAAVLDGERLLELRDQDAAGERVTDEVFLARVSGVEPRLNAAFLDCGLPEQGFVTAKDARAAAGVPERQPIRTLLREGQRILVQGLREAADDKGPRFTTDVRLFGLALVYTPLNPQLEPTARSGRPGAGAARERARALFPEGHYAVRRHAVDAPDEALRAEAGLLAARWKALQEAAAGLRRPGRLPAPERPLERLLRGLLEWAPERIEVADQVLWTELRRLAGQAPAFPPGIDLERLPPDRPAFASAGVDEELERALSPEVPLPGGGRLRIETTAACVAIDVDGSGRTPLETDLEAAAEIGRQVRLRNLGGTILVDFIDLVQRHDQRRLEEAVKRAFRHDPLPVEVHALPALGLIVLSRARRGEPLAARLERACPACGGAGSAPSLRAQAERLLAELRQRPLPPAAVRAAPDLDAFLAGEAAASWRQAAARVGPLSLRADPVLPAGAYAIEG